MARQDRDVAHDKRVRNKAQTSTNTQDTWKGFVNCEIPAAQHDAVRMLRGDTTALWNVVFDLVEAEYKLTISYDPQHDAYNISLTCRNNKDRNEGYTLSGRGGGIVSALAAFVFKHTVLLEGDWTTAAVSTGRRFGADDFA